MRQEWVEAKGFLVAAFFLRRITLKLFEEIFLLEEFQCEIFPKEIFEMMSKKQHTLELAQAVLSRLREGAENCEFDACLQVVENAIAAGNTPEEIGLSREELANLRGVRERLAGTAH